MRNVLALIAMALVVACGQPASNGAQAPAAFTPGIDINDEYATPTPGGVDVSAGYITIQNRGAEDDRLISASSPRAGSVELHSMEMVDNVMRMRQIEGGVVVPAGGEAVFAQGGDHLMFMGVTQPFVAGEEIPVTLVFERAGELTIAMPVQGLAEQHDGD